MLTHGSLFAGIGGFDLGFERAGIKTVWQVEINPFCRRVLEQHFPDAKRFEDVRGVGASELARVDVITGGFPCQDISIATRGATKGIGLDGERSGLWREYARIIGEIKPRWVVVENSPALAIRGLDRVLAALSGLGFDAMWTTISASEVGARHRRERMFICAHSVSDGLQGGMQDGAVAHFSISALGDVADFPAISTPIGCRGSDGIPHRVDRLKGLGNAVVPQIAEWIGRRIVKAFGEADHVPADSRQVP